MKTWEHLFPFSLCLYIKRSFKNNLKISSNSSFISFILPLLCSLIRFLMRPKRGCDFFKEIDTNLLRSWMFSFWSLIHPTQRSCFFSYFFISFYGGGKGGNCFQLKRKTTVPIMYKLTFSILQIKFLFYKLNCYSTNYFFPILQTNYRVF